MFRPASARRCTYEDLYVWVPHPARRAQPRQALGHDHRLHRLPQRLHDLNIFASLIEVNVDSMVSYLGSQNEMVVYVDPEADDATIQSVGNALSGTQV